jgi:hypothetical protein
MTPKSPARTVLAVAAGLALMAAGCSTDPPEVPRTPEASSPFLVDAPEGYELDTAARGEVQGWWGDDSEGSSGGFVALASSRTEDVVVVEAAGFEGVQGGLDQLSSGDELEVDGRRAIFHRGDGASFDELVVERGDDLALVIRARDLDLDGLLELNEGSTLDPDPSVHRVVAPSVAPPAGMTVIGGADRDLVLAMAGYGDAIPGPASAHVARWRQLRSTDHELLAMTLPAAAGDPGAALGWPLVREFDEASVARIEVDDRPAAYVVMEQGDITSTMLVTTTEWGDLLVLRSQPSHHSGGDALTRDQLVTIAESARRLTDAEWAALPSRY